MLIKDILYPNTDIYRGIKVKKPTRLKENGCFVRAVWGKITENTDFTKNISTLENGCWMGHSANALCNYLKQKTTNFELICVDTFLGSITHSENDKKYLKFKHVYPQIYQEFLNRTKYFKNTQYICPFPQTSTSAMAFFKVKNILFDYIVVDASHESLDIYLDLMSAWLILKPNGIIVGDDFLWESVQCGLRTFLNEQKLNAYHWGNQYLIGKSPDFKLDIIRET